VRRIMTILELIASVMGLLSVWLTVRQNIWCWPAGLVMVLLYAWIFAAAKLYSDAGLQVVYVVLSVYGWIHWARGGPRDNGLPVTVLSDRSRALWAAATLAAAAALGTATSAWTDASMPYADALITCMSLTAQWLLARKKVESWWLWIAVDVLAVGVFLHKGLYVTSGLYAVFLVLAALGLRSWTRSLEPAAGSFSGSSCPRMLGTSS